MGLFSQREKAIVKPLAMASNPTLNPRYGNHVHTYC
jgi:hypothetical protein